MQLLQTLITGYTIYSTTGAFYVPLVVMCILYFRVFKATKNRRKAWIPIPLPASALMKANNTRGPDRGATTEMLVLVSVYKKYYLGMQKRFPSFLLHKCFSLLGRNYYSKLLGPTFPLVFSPVTGNDGSDTK